MTSQANEDDDEDWTAPDYLVASSEAGSDYEPNPSQHLELQIIRNRRAARRPISVPIGGNPQTDSDTEDEEHPVVMIFDVNHLTLAGRNRSELLLGRLLGRRPKPRPQPRALLGKSLQRLHGHRLCVPEFQSLIQMSQRKTSGRIWIGLVKLKLLPATTYWHVAYRLKQIVTGFALSSWSRWRNWTKQSEIFCSGAVLEPTSQTLCNHLLGS
ncbi:hypothetical protein B0H11DRAFT_2187111 [Mycena galericulata]|nr:hypothetical protein B0H11DRAFT_2187111 [Mycena galericulata]